MSISSTNRKAGPYTGNGATTQFSFSFKVFQASDLLVVRAVTATAVETTLVLNTDYTVSLNANQDTSPGGTITVTSAPSAAQTITITSSVGELQPVALTNLGGFFPEVINSALDRLTILVQQLRRDSDRSVKVNLSSTTSPDQIISDINAAANSATASAASASGSAAAAAASESAAAGSAAAALGYKNTIGSTNGLVKGDGAGNISAATPGTDFVAPGTNTAFTKAQRGSVSTLTDGATITPDFSLANNYEVTLGGNRTLANPTNIVAGQSGVIRVVQDGTGSRTLAFGSYWKFQDGVAPTLTTTASAVDLIAYHVETSTRIAARFIGDVK